MEFSKHARAFAGVQLEPMGTVTPGSADSFLTPTQGGSVSGLVEEKPLDRH